MTARTLFVTGTDTGVGKTRVACALIRLARARGIDACGFKPVASGCERVDGRLRNQDALALQAASGGAEPYEAVNPFTFEPAIAPHLAAREAGRRIDIGTLDAAHAALATRHELIVVEGAGGWQVPLDDGYTLADWVGGHRWPVLLVVGLRLGCLNHALLSAESIARRTALAGWIANRLPPAQARWQDNVADLRARLPAPLWGIVGEGQDGPAAQRALETPPALAGLRGG